MPPLCERETSISIIIPVYNLEKHITPMLDSLKAQNLGEYTAQIIFVLNNCTDHSEDVIRDSGLDCEIINCEIQGCGPARNAGMDIATGKYIWFMDGDDWLLSDTAVKDALTAAELYDLSVLRIPYESDTFKWFYFSMVWQYLFKREFINEFRFPNKQPAEDDEFTAQVLTKAGYNRVTLVYLPTIGQKLYYYNYLREGSNMYRYTVLGERI